jgi:peptidoglycan/xylan/chitin deacetylase (PgdA/CDA1 family)
VALAAAGLRKAIKSVLLGGINGIGRSLGGAPWGQAAHILTYHQVRRLPADIRDPYNEVTLERLMAHVAALQAAGLRLVTVSDLWKRVQAGGDPRRLVALTFDDGLVEHDELVAPALQRAQAAATFYVPSACLGRAAEEVGYQGRHLDADGLRRLEAAGMEVGSHSRTHPVLARLQAAGLADEISGSHRDLEEILGHPLRTFSYPYGSRRTFDERVTAAVRTAGYETAVCTIPGGNRAGTPPYELRRIAVYQSDDAALVVAKARGGLDWTGALQEIWLRLFPHHSVRSA